MTYRVTEKLTGSAVLTHTDIYTVPSVNPVNDLSSDRQINWICCTYTDTDKHTQTNTHRQTHTHTEGVPSVNPVNDSL